jgi:hypothetical protein
MRYADEPRQESSSLDPNDSISSWTNDTPTESDVVYRKMSTKEAALSFRGQFILF